MTAETIPAPSSLERKLPLIINMSEVDAQAQKRLLKMGKTMKMSGFRPGKVPMKVVQQTYGAQAQSEAIGDVVSRAYSQAVVAQKIRPAGPPNIVPVEPPEASDEGSAPKELRFEAVVEVYPDIAVPERGNLAVERWSAEPVDADVDRTLETLRRQKVTHETTDRPAQADDRVRLDFEGSIDGVAFDGGSSTDFQFVVGAGQMLPEFDAAVVGMRATDTKTFPLTFPADYRATNLAGKESQFKITLHEVLGPVLPALDDALAAAFGVEQGGLDKLRDDVRKNLTREVQIRCKTKTKQSVMDALLTASAFDVPKALIDGESQRMADQMREQMVSQGMNAKDAPFPVELFREGATRRVRLGLLVSEIVRAQKLQANEVQLRVLLGEMAESYEKPEEFIRWTLSQADRRAEAEAIVTEDNVVEWVLAAARVQTKAVSVEELMKEAS